MKTHAKEPRVRSTSGKGINRHIAKRYTFVKDDNTILEIKKQVV